MNVLLSVNLDHVLLPNWEEVQKLRKFFPDIIFQQRKTYDEYYILTKDVKAELRIFDLMALSTEFKVEMRNSYISLSNE